MLVPMIVLAQSKYKEYIKAAKKGNADAQFYIGLCYSKGEDVEKDEKKAVYWWRKAAAQGEKLGIKRMNEIGNDLIKKYSLDQNNQAQEKTMTAAEAKSKGAQYYEQKNYAEAFKYFKMAATMNVIKRTLSISIARGQDADGNTVTKAYTYSNVKPDAEPAKILAVGKALGGLFDNDITGLVVVERSSLTEE